jgi:hypothetical protein
MADEAETPVETTADAAIERAVHAALDATHASKPDYAKIVAAWVNDKIMNTPSSADTAGFNHLTGDAIPELIRRLEAA